MSATFSFDKCHVEVEFMDGLSTEQVITSICQLSNPQVIIWYIGCYGLKKAGVQFYKDFLISPVLRQSVKATFWLVDLTAWGAFKNLQCSIRNFNSCCNEIERFLDKQIKCIKSAKIFKKIQEISEKDLVDYFRRALHRRFISKASKHFPNKNICIKEIFSDNCPILSDWYNHDANKSYSILQYLEGCLLVDEIFMEQAANREVTDIQIVFALPNDEIKYYRDKKNSFQKDIRFLISKRHEILNIKNIRLQVKFLAFKYGFQPHERPYNASGKVLKNDQLSYEDVVGYARNKEEILRGEFIYAPNL
ncbi:MAG: hypothetical protein HYZ54_05920 [Ignavibacteriae bacterium]|nr:hypothetical protein [Ignavibacteriota bacterium]